MEGALGSPLMSTTTHILVFIGDLTRVLALLSGKVHHLASQVGQGILYNVSGVGGAGDGDVMLKRPITWAETTRKGGIQWVAGVGRWGQAQLCTLHDTGPLRRMHLGHDF